MIGHYCFFFARLLRTERPCADLVLKEAKMQAGLKTCLSLVATLAVAAAIVFFVVRDAQAGAEENIMRYTKDTEHYEKEKAESQVGRDRHCDRLLFGCLMAGGASRDEEENPAEAEADRQIEQGQREGLTISRPTELTCRSMHARHYCQLPMMDLQIASETARIREQVSALEAKAKGGDAAVSSHLFFCGRPVL